MSLENQVIIVFQKQIQFRHTNAIMRYSYLKNNIIYFKFIIF